MNFKNYLLVFCAALISGTLSAQEETQNQQMLKLPRKLDWMHCKYGDDTTPFEVTILMANNQGGVNGAWSDSADNN